MKIRTKMVVFICPVIYIWTQLTDYILVKMEYFEILCQNYSEIRIEFLSYISEKIKNWKKPTFPRITPVKYFNNAISMHQFWSKLPMHVLKDQSHKVPYSLPVHNIQKAFAF